MTPSSHTTTLIGMSRIQLNLIISTVLLASSLAACGGDGKSADTPTDFFNSLRDSVCNYEVECGSMPDVATCEAVTARLWQRG